MTHARLQTLPRPSLRFGGPRLALLTMFYEDADARRRAEFLDCLAYNVANELFSDIHLFLEDSMASDSLVTWNPVLRDRKVSLVENGRRATYRELFDYASSSLSGRRVVIANADIYFGDDLARLDAYDLAGKLLCLSRWDVQADGSARFFEHGESQDAWIFDAPIRSFACDFPLGVPGCENRLAWEAAQAGLVVENPGRSLRAYHLHLSGVRHYTQRERITGTTLSVPASFLGPAPDIPSASVAFTETMGYAIAKLEIGASSHVNDMRPFTSIPEPVRGHRFTQVVAGSVSPIEVEFLTAGKLFVLVGNDWYGHGIAQEWLATVGYDERLPLVETSAGTGFEAWSVLGASGTQLAVPTQVMLVAERLRRRTGV